MTLHDQIKRAMCCPTGMCSSPGDCYATGHRDVPVKLDAAAKAVARVIQDAWRKQAGPWSRSTTLEAAQKALQADDGLSGGSGSPSQ